MAILANVQAIEEFKVSKGLDVRQPYNDIESKDYLNTHFDPSSNTQWTSFRRYAPAHMTLGVLDDLKKIQNEIIKETNRDLEANHEVHIRYHVLASEIPEVFNLGGDLEYLSKLIREEDKESLLSFSRACVELVHNNAVSYHLPITTISLVQGTALAGGFEAALSSNILVAERQTKMSLPEVMFNMFPGMGAYQLLCRRVSPAIAERIILSGKTYTAEELFSMGIVDILAEPGGGEEAVWAYIKRHRNQSNAEWSFRQMVNDTNPPLRLDDLYRSVEHWVKAALRLKDDDLKHLDFLIRVQKNMKPQKIRCI